MQPWCQACLKNPQAIVFIENNSLFLALILPHFLQILQNLQGFIILIVQSLQGLHLIIK